MSLKGAIIGFGHIAANGHVPAYKRNPNFKICAVFDKCPSREKVNKELLPQAKFYSCVKELLKKEQIDFLDIATPPALHAEYILEALAQKKHVLCEKPLVIDENDIKKIWNNIKSSGCVVVTVHNWRYSPVIQKISKIIASGQLGATKKVKYNVIRFQPSIAVNDKNSTTNWRLDPSIAGGGILVDHGWHAFYLTNEWIGSEPETIECLLENRKYKDISVEDTANVEITYSNGAKALLYFTWAGTERKNTIEIEAENGSIICADHIIHVKNGKKNYTIEFDQRQKLSGGSHHPEWYDSVLKEFLEEINSQDKRSKNFKEAATCFSMLLNCKKSNLHRVPVKMSKLLELT